MYTIAANMNILVDTGRGLGGNRLINTEINNMKTLIALLFFCLSANALAQVDSISKFSVISIENRSILYRGITNPVKILVNNAKSFTATAPGLKQIDDSGNYEFNVTGVSGTTLTVDIDIILNNGEHKKEQHFFEIREIDFPYIKIGNIKFTTGTTIVLSEQDLEKKIEFDYPVIQFNKISIVGFEIGWPENTVIASGDKFTPEVIKKFNSLPNGTRVKINIKYYFKGAENYTLKDVYFYLLKYQ
jgi:hypothetical protein